MLGLLRWKLMNNSLRRWLTNKYSVSWQLALALFLNYPVTGLFFGETVTAYSGVTNHVVDLVTGISCVAIILLFGALKKFTKVSSLAFTASAYAFSTTFSIFVSNVFRNESGFVPNDLDVTISGVMQMFAIHVLFAMAISSLMESRAERKILELQRARLEATKQTFESQILEISDRLTIGVNQKLSLLLSGLQGRFESPKELAPEKLASYISEALNEGVRPLSWEIEKQELIIDSPQKVQTKKIGLIERFRFPIAFNRVISIRLLTLLYLFFDIPVMYFYFGLDAAFQSLLVIIFTASALWGIKSLVGSKEIQSWISITVYGLTVALCGSMFILFRAITGSLTADVAEIALVFSMVQIAVIAAIFQSALVRRYSYIEDQRSVNVELESLVSQLRQSAWVAKKKLARLVHGQVQSELFAAYLQLSQAKSADQSLYEQVTKRIRHAHEALSQSGEDGTNFESTLNDIVSTWGSSFSVNTDISAPALSALQSDPVAATCALEVILEGVNNAAKYGTAGSANVSVNLTPDSRLYIEVVNEADDSEFSAPGYGSNVLDEITHEWSFEIQAGKAKLAAEVILNQN